jgi:hypothetical protein
MTPKQYQPRTMKGTARSYADNPGKLFHALRPGEDVAICGTRPGKTSAGWDPFIGRNVTCHKCLKRLALLPKDPIDTPAILCESLGEAFLREAALALSGGGNTGAVVIGVGHVLTRASVIVAYHVITARDLDNVPDVIDESQREAEGALQGLLTQELAGAEEAGLLPFRRAAGF